MGKSFSFQEKLQEKRILFLFDDVDNKNSQEIISKMIIYETQNTKKPIWLYINSSGGDVTAGLSVIDVMKLIKTPVYTLIVGEACSIAGLIAICGDKRYITENGYFMAHLIYFGTQDYITFVDERYKQARESFDLILSLYKKYTNLTRKDYEKIEKGELWLNARQCLKKGIVDSLLKEIKI